MIYTIADRRPILEGSGHFIADNATVIGSVKLKDAASVWFNCVLRGDMDRIEIGSRSNIQDGSVLHVDHGMPLTVGDDVTVGHKVMLHGCTIGDESLIGIGSTVLNGARIARHCIVGANALVTEGKEFPERSLILGAPAKVVRELSDEEIQGIREAADHYVANARHYGDQLRSIQI